MDSRLIFLCWSGTRSNKVATALESAIRDLECGLEPFRSPGIEKGSIWFDQVRLTLDRADAVIVCLTPENSKGAWIHFEAGALASKMAPKATDSELPRVFPYLFRMQGDELQGPLAQYQATNATEEDTLRLFRQLIPADEQQRWKEASSKFWTKLETELHEAEDRPLAEILPEFERLFHRKTFEEPLDECVNQDWPSRWSGARETHGRLSAKTRDIALQCRPYVGDSLKQLASALDAYAMALGLLLEPSDFKLTDEGRRAVPTGLLLACERRRKHVKALVSLLADPRESPIFEDSPKFHAMETFPEKKTVIHRFERWLDAEDGEKRKDWRLMKASRDDSAQISRWHFDRIAFYVGKERTGPPLATSIEWLRTELEMTRAEGAGTSHMPLTYSLAPLRKAIEKASSSGKDRLLFAQARALLKDVCDLARVREEAEKAKEPSRLRVRAEELLQLIPLDEPVASQRKRQAKSRRR